MLRIARINDDARHRDALEIVARNVRPGVATIGALHDAVSEVTVAGQGTLAGPGVDDGVIGWRNGESTDRQRRLVVRLGNPRPSGGIEEPDAALRSTEDPLPVRRSDGQRSDSPRPIAGGDVVRIELNDGVG